MDQRTIRLATTRLLGFAFIVVIAELASAVTFTTQQSSILNNANFDSRSASLADYDDDGDLDLFFQGGGSSQQLLRNNLIGTGTLDFTNVTASLPAGLTPSWSAAWADYDGDGNVDVFVGQSNISDTGDVLKNTGSGTFTNASVATGLDDPGFHQNVAWSDIDNDQDLDLILVMEGPTEKHEIYLQGPGGTFSPVGASVGFQQSVGIKGYGMAIGDTDGDGDMDIYISTCIASGIIRNNFYRNNLVETGSLSFTDIADTNGTQYMNNSYGAEFVDFNDDGLLDLFVVGADGQQSKMWRNDGGNNFTDVDTITGHALLTDIGGDFNGGKAVDYDNDGDLDLFFHDKLAKNGHNTARKLYRNDGNWEFTDVTVAEGLDFQNQGAHDSTWGDIDNDGDQDLIAPTNSSWFERVFISDANTNGNHWLYIDLHGPTYNTTGLGSALYATVEEGTLDEKTLRREANTNAGTFNQSDLPVHFGLGDSTLIDKLEIQWPDGTEQLLFNVGVDQYLDVDIVTGLQGDFNGDNVVDDADYTVWLAALGSSDESLISNRGDGTGGVTENDYTLWKSQFGQTAPGVGSAESAVPEPTSWFLLFSSISFFTVAVRSRC